MFRIYFIHPRTGERHFYGKPIEDEARIKRIVEVLNTSPCARLQYGYAREDIEDKSMNKPEIKPRTGGTQWSGYKEGRYVCSKQCSECVHFETSGHVTVKGDCEKHGVMVSHSDVCADFSASFLNHNPENIEIDYV